MISTGYKSPRLYVTVYVIDGELLESQTIVEYYYEYTVLLPVHSHKNITQVMSKTLYLSHEIYYVVWPNDIWIKEWSMILTTSCFFPWQFPLGAKKSFRMRTKGTFQLQWNQRAMNQQIFLSIRNALYCNIAFCLNGLRNTMSNASKYIYWSVYGQVMEELVCIERETCYFTNALNQMHLLALLHVDP